MSEFQACQKPDREGGQDWFHSDRESELPSLMVGLLTPSDARSPFESTDAPRDNTFGTPDKLTSNTEKPGGTMLVNWIKDADAALQQAKSEKKPLLIDFSAAPA